MTHQVARQGPFVVEGAEGWTALGCQLRIVDGWAVWFDHDHERCHRPDEITVRELTEADWPLASTEPLPLAQLVERARWLLYLD